MVIEILLALVASVFTATSSVVQRVAARPAQSEVTFSWRVVAHLLKRPIWFLGILCMIAGFLFQLAALRFGDLSVVQPVIATELLFVFVYLAMRNHRAVHTREWLAAVGMAVGLGAFLFLANPSGGSATEATTWHWILAASSTFAAAAAVAIVATVPFRGRAPSPVRKAAMLSVSAGIVWGFVAAVIKELSAHIGQGWYAVFTNWSPYALLLSGAVGMFIVSNAFQSGPLAASQPGLTIVDPLVASLLGVTLFGEHLHDGPYHLAGEAIAVVVIVASVILLARSPLIRTQGAGVDEGGEDRAREGAPPGLAEVSGTGTSGKSGPTVTRREGQIERSPNVETEADRHARSSRRHGSAIRRSRTSREL